MAYLLFELFKRCCNMDLTYVPKLKEFIKPSIIVNRSGYKIGIIGYVTTDTPVSI